MNVGVYSFEIMKFKELEFLNTNSMFMIGIEDIYLYSENNVKERIKEKTIFEKMLKELLEKDYRFYYFEGNIHNLNTSGKIFTKNLIGELEENTRWISLKNKNKEVYRKKYL